MRESSKFLCGCCAAASLAAFCLAVLLLVPFHAYADDSEWTHIYDRTGADTGVAWRIEGDVLYVDKISSESDGNVFDNAFTCVRGAVSRFSSITPEQKDAVKGIVIGSGVTSIGKSAFNNFANCTYVDMSQSGITEKIGTRAFYQLNNLSSIKFPSTLGSIEKSAFCQCNGLEGNLDKLSIPEGCEVDYLAFEPFTWGDPPVEPVEPAAPLWGGTDFGYDAQTKTLTVTKAENGDGVTGRVEALETALAAQGIAASDIVNVVIADGVKGVGHYAFPGKSAPSPLSNLTTVKIAASVESIGMSAFWRCESLSSVEFEEGSKMSSIGVDAFGACPNLKVLDLSRTQITEVPASLCRASHSNGQIVAASGVETVLLPDTVTTLKDGAFANATNIKKIVLPSSVTTIMRSAFDLNLGMLVIPSDIKLVDVSEYPTNTNNFTTTQVVVCGTTDVQSMLENEQFAKLSNAANNPILYRAHGDDTVTSYPVSLGANDISFTCSSCDKTFAVTATVEEVTDADQLTPFKGAAATMRAAYRVSVADADGAFECDKSFVVSVPVENVEDGAQLTVCKLNDEGAVIPSATATVENGSVTFDMDTSSVFALMQANKHIVSFDSLGGNAVDAQLIAHGDVPAKPADPTREGYEFTGWYADKDASTPFDFAQPVTADTTVYAGWKAVAAPEVPGAGDSGQQGSGNVDAPAGNASGQAQQPVVLAKTSDPFAAVGTVIAVVALGSAAVAATTRRRGSYASK